jgi:hypothetical protein
VTQCRPCMSGVRREGEGQAAQRENKNGCAAVALIWNREGGSAPVESSVEARAPVVRPGHEASSEVEEFHADMKKSQKGKSVQCSTHL